VQNDTGNSLRSSSVAFEEINMMVRGGGGLTGLYATTVLNQRGLSESVLPQVGAMQLA
jgi:hypothetical protein